MRLRVAYLIRNTISCGVLLLCSALAAECETSHLSHFSQNESLVLDYITFARCRTKCYIILGRSRHTGENCSGTTLTINIFLLTSLSLSLALLSWSLALSLSLPLSLSITQSLALSNLLYPPSIVLSVYLSLSLSHPLTYSIRLISSLSLSLSLPLSCFLSLSLSRAPPGPPYLHYHF